MKILTPLPPLEPKERLKRRREALAIILLAGFFIFLTFAEFQLTQVAKTLPFVNSIFFFGLLNVNIIILILLVWLVFRNIGKLFLERRRKILGARLKTKLVIAFLGLSITPTLVLFLISALYINSSFEKWFSLKIQNTLQASLDITQTYYRNTAQTAMHFAEHLADGLAPKWSAADSSEISSVLESYLRVQRELLALDAVEVYGDPLEERFLARRPASPEVPDQLPRLPVDVLERAFLGEKFFITQHVGSGDLIRCLAGVRKGGSIESPVSAVLVVSSYIPVSLKSKVAEITSVYEDYKETNPLKYPMKTTYLLILIMITLVIIFVAIWIGLYIARELTVPVERLVLAAQAVGAGNLDVSISAVGHDEIAVLVESFNKMTRDLKDHQERLTEAGADIERRRLQLEAVLANVGTGVIAVDRDGVVTTFNRAVARLLEIEPSEALGKKYGDLLVLKAAPLALAIDQAFRGSSGAGMGEPELTQWNVHLGESVQVLSAIATPLQEGGAQWGVVSVIDDMTHLIKGQREMAWREVARRIAHEIKNPLTPIKLSAQRLQRRLGALAGRDGALMKECTDTIIRHTDELKEMVNEFSNFARFPEASPAPHDLNKALGDVLPLFEQAHPSIGFKVELEPRMPIFEFDRDQIKRVVINLLDNAVAALNSLPVGAPKRINVSTFFNEELKIAVVEIGDNGPGISEDVKARIFEPYFSTKTEGTGLGLAITKRIINDHDGFIRVHSAVGEGTRFVIELPTTVRNQLEQRSPRV